MMITDVACEARVWLAMKAHCPALAQAGLGKGKSEEAAAVSLPRIARVRSSS